MRQVVQQLWGLGDDRVNSKDRWDRVEQEIGLTARTGGTGWNKSSHGHTPVASKDAYLNSLCGGVGGLGSSVRMYSRFPTALLGVVNCWRKAEQL